MTMTSDWNSVGYRLYQSVAKRIPNMKDAITISSCFFAVPTLPKSIALSALCHSLNFAPTDARVEAMAPPVSRTQQTK